MTAQDAQASIQHHIAKGQELFAAGQYAEALKHFLEWANLDAKNQKAREEIADTLHKLGRTAEAVTMYKSVAAAYLASGAMIKAIAVHKTILSLNPSDEEVKKQLLSIFGSKVPAELQSVVQTPSSATKSPAPPPAKGHVTADNLGLGHLETKKASLPPDELNKVFSDLLGEEAGLRESEVPSSPEEAFMRTPLFSALKPEELNALIDKLKLSQFSPGQVVCKEGDAGNILYVIVQGTVDITTQRKDGVVVHLASLGEGDFFGEGGFVTGQLRTASVSAKTPITVLEITKADFDAAAKVHPRMKDVLEIFYHNRLVDRAMAHSELFGQLPSFRRAELMQSFGRKAYKAGEFALEAGKSNELFFMIKSGKFEILVDRGGKKEVAALLGPGEFFGEASALTGQSVNFSARAQLESEVVTLRKIEVEGIMQMFPETEPLLKKISEQRLQNLWTSR